MLSPWPTSMTCTRSWPSAAGASGTAEAVGTAGALRPTDPAGTAGVVDTGDAVGTGDAVTVGIAGGATDGSATDALCAAWSALNVDARDRANPTAPAVTSTHRTRPTRRDLLSLPPALRAVGCGDNAPLEGAGAAGLVRRAWRRVDATAGARAGVAGTTAVPHMGQNFAVACSLCPHR